MKRPSCLIGTTLATTLSCLQVHAQADGLAGQPHLQQHYAEEEQNGPLIVPVPPAMDDDDDSDGLLGSTPRSMRELTHRPHPSYLNQTLNTSPSSLPPRRKLWHSTTGTFHNLVLLLRFSDHTSRKLPTQADISRLYNSEETPPTTITSSGYISTYNYNPDNDPSSEDVAPTGSVRQVYQSNSHGTFTIDTTVVDWITLDHPEAYYADGNHGFSKFKEAIIEGLTKLDTSNSQFDFTEFDLDENGALDGLGILHSGFGAEFGGTDCEGQENEDRIWSHKGGLEWTSSPQQDGDTVNVNRYYVSSALRGKCHANIVRMGVICHELGHYLGLPDLYDSTFDGAGLGAYDFMSLSWGWDGSGLYPPNLSAWSKQKAGWADIETIEYDGTYEIQDSESSSKVYKLTTGFPEDEYILIENRQPSGYDSRIEGMGGLAIYHVDEKARQNKRGYPGMEQDSGSDSDEWPLNGKHYRVALLGADGNYDLERGLNQGDDTDLWHSGSVLTELNTGEYSLFPNTDAYRKDHVGSTGIRIYGFSDSGNVMSFSVSGLGSPPIVPEQTPEPTTSKPTSLPTNKPITPAPTNLPTPVPTTRMPTSKPVTGAPTQEPSSSPITPMPTTSHPTHLPTSEPTPEPTQSMIIAQGLPLDNQQQLTNTAVTTITATAASTSEEQQQCTNLCLEPIPSTQCPYPAYTLYSLLDCHDVQIGEMCDGDGECGTDNFLNNCAAYDVYKRVDCGNVDSSNGSDIDSIVAAPGASASSLVVQTNNPTNEPTTKVPTKSPSKKPAESTSIGLKSAPKSASTSSSGSGGSSANNNNDNNTDCPYYPGWNVGISHCLKDCHQPSYMRSNPIFEFNTLDGCCSLHYPSYQSCREDSMLAIKKQMLQDEGLLAINSVSGKVDGQVWRDVNGNGWQDTNERSMVSGVYGVLVDVYDCTSFNWVKGTRTSLDGTYLLGELTIPGQYYVQVTPPGGFTLSPGHAWAEDEFNSDFDRNTGLSDCVEFASGSGGKNSATLNAGLVPTLSAEDKDGDDEGDDVMVTKTELVSKAVDESNIEHEDETEMVEEATDASYSTSMHTKSRTSNSSQNTVQQNGNDANVALSPPASSTSHAKSFLRGGSTTGDSSSSSASSFASTNTVTIIVPTDDATIQSNSDIMFVGGTSELRVGPQLTWQDDILLKFDVTPSALPGSLDYRAAHRAVLRLYALTSSPSGGVVYIASSSSDDPSNGQTDWTEETVDWTSAPQADNILATIGATRPNSWVEVDVTGMLLSEVGVETLRIVPEESNRSWVTKYSSKENEMGYPCPELRLYF